MPLVTVKPTCQVVIPTISLIDRERFRHAHPTRTQISSAPRSAERES